MRLRSSRRIASPVAFASGVVLPAEFLDWDRQKLRIVLAHERSHILQGDFFLQMLASLHVALFWFSPLSWWLKRKLSDLGEAISDHAGLEAAASRASYAQVLLEFAALPRPTPSLGVAMAHSSNLSHRMERFLSESRFHQAFAVSRRRALLAVLLVHAAIFAFTALIRVEAAVTQTTAQSAADQAPPPPAPLPPPPPPPGPPTPGHHGLSMNTGQGVYCTFSSSGEWYAVVTDPKTEVKACFNDNGSEALNQELAYARKQAHGSFLWFSHDGKAYLVEDPAMVARMESIVKRNEAIVNSLASSQEAKRLGVKVVNGNLLVTGASMGELLSKLGEEGDRIGEEWGKLSSEADSKMRAIINESLSNDTAHEAAPPPPSKQQLPPLPPLPPTPPGFEDRHPMSYGPDYSYSYSAKGDSYALVTGSDNRTFDSNEWDSDTTRTEIDKARKLAHGEFLLFKRNGKFYLLDDPTVTAQIEAMDKPMEALGKEQEELDRQQKELAKQMEEVNQRMKKATVPTPDMSKEFDEIEKQMTKLRAMQGKSMTTEQWADLESKLGNLQGKLGAIQGEIGAKQGAIGGEMGKLGGLMGALGGKQGELGAKQGRLAEEADRKIKAIIDKALQEGKARPVE
jgi:hypothetical protein